MRYGLSPAERNLALADLHAMNKVEAVKQSLPKLKKFSLEERFEMSEIRRESKQKLYGRMKHRKKPDYS